MKVVIDTNILISAVLKDRDPETIILAIAQDPIFHWIASPPIVNEYKAVLIRPKFGLNEAQQREWFQLIDTYVKVIPVSSTLDFPRDPKDAPFLACAIATQADYLVTGDRDLLENPDLVKTQIVSVAQFKAISQNF
ncbi:MAG: putative toxin-antitoxin system toxin component, PIN family [Prochlorotrichaceae cyanobacterium]